MLSEVRPAHPLLGRRIIGAAIKRLLDPVLHGLTTIRKRNTAQNGARRGLKVARTALSASQNDKGHNIYNVGGVH